MVEFKWAKYPKNPINKCVSCIYYEPIDIRLTGMCVCNEASIHRKNRYANDRCCKFYKMSESELFIPDKKIVKISFSGGKDSTAMLHMMIDKKEQIDEIMFFETGWDFPEMEDHIKKVEANIGRKITRVRFYRHFDELLQRWGWPHHKGGWCVRCKVMTANQFARNINCTTECIGFSSSEEHRTKRITINNKKWNVRYPLIEYGIDKKEALSYCRSLGYDWDGLYDVFNRVSCWCCPKGGWTNMEKVKANFPELYERFLEMDEIAKDKHKFPYFF